jgi:hypothetical protein
MRGPSARIVAVAAVLSAALVSSCAALSGLDSFGIVDCVPGSSECADAGALPDAAPDRDEDTSTPPSCDPKTDPACLPLPVGWTLVAMAAATDGGPPPSCPTGLETASDVGEGPTARSDTCQCTSCTVTQPASCAGTITSSFGSGGVCPSPGTGFGNSPPGNCLADPFVGDRTGSSIKLTLPAATGGQCTAAAVLDAERVDFAARSRVCDGTARCSGGVCDARVAAPFVACIASPVSAADDDRACPSDYPTKHLVGTAAAFTCGATCTCGVTRSCTGSLTFYSDGACANGAKTVAADAACHDPGFAGAYLSYKATTTPTTTCTSAGTSTATNGRLTAARTICCR